MTFSQESCFLFTRIKIFQRKLFQPVNDYRLRAILRSGFPLSGLPLSLMRPGRLRVYDPNRRAPATSAAYENRADQNAKVVDVLHEHQHVWRDAGGPSIQRLFRPSAADLERCQMACTALEELRIKYEHTDGFDEYAQQITDYQ